ncbi:MAG: hypothetical protein P9L92_17450 [Candidatus Electryonea clarkiae]|nr:hypothetical protein [Candidatus Electryonea clarkiae]MDP8287289.1 hypothetical protein [Candidatus Electryonea clarkiae]
MDRIKVHLMIGIIVGLLSCGCDDDNSSGPSSNEPIIVWSQENVVLKHNEVVTSERYTVPEKGYILVELDLRDWEGSNGIEILIMDDPNFFYFINGLDYEAEHKTISSEGVHSLESGTLNEGDIMTVLIENSDIGWIQGSTDDANFDVKATFRFK